jgi:hypothetical protein
LNDARAKYLIVGGYAVIKHTEPRYTKDLDIWVSPDLENAKRVFAALQHFGAPLHGIAVEDFTNPDVVYHMGRSPARVDILMHLKGLDFDAAWNNRVAADFGDVPTQFIASQDLIVNKKLAGRPQDLIDVENLLLAGKQSQEH